MVSDFSNRVKIRSSKFGLYTFLFSAFSLLFSVSAHSLPLDILPLPNEVSFPKGGSSFDEGLLRPWYTAINDSGLVVGEQLSNDSKYLGITLWDAVNNREIGNALIELKLSHSDNENYAIRNAISVSDNSRLLVLITAYHFTTNKEELLAYRGSIDSLTQISAPLAGSEFPLVSTAASSGERIVIFPPSEIEGGNGAYNSFSVGPDANFTPIDLKFSPQSFMATKDKFYFVERQSNLNSRTSSYDYRVYDRSDGSPVASYTSSSDPIAISKELSVLSLGFGGKLSLRSLANPSKPKIVAQRFSESSSVNTVPGLGFALTISERERYRALFLSNEGLARDGNCLLPRADSSKASVEKLRIRDFITSSSSYYLASGEYSRDSFNSPVYSFLVRPDFNQKFDNYCARLDIKPIGSCVSHYEKNESSSNTRYLKSGSKLNHSCQYEIKLASEDRERLIPTSIEIVGNKGRKTSKKKLTLPSGRGTVTLSPQDFDYVHISAVPLKKSSPFFGSSGTVALTN